MECFRIEKTDFEVFLLGLMKGHQVVAPVKRDLVRFESVEDVKDIFLGERSFFPAKKYFFPQEEVLFRFDGMSVEVPVFHRPKRVFFGLRRCDLNAIKHQDLVFLQDAHDPYYAAAREHSLLLGYHCETAPSEYCFCDSMDLAEFFDLMFYDRGEYYLVEVGSEKGKGLVDDHSGLFRRFHRLISQMEKRIPGADRLERKEIGGLYDHPDWKKGVDQCLSCGACTALCPTCYCFEIKDEVGLADVKKGSRNRKWSSCQLQEFTRVAGGHVFREKREERFKHRIFHQLEYFREKYGVDLCVGCGRCIEGCPTRIDFVELINGMKMDEKKDV